MLMGIGGETTRFVPNNSSTQTTVLMSSPTHPPSASISVANEAKINNATAAKITAMSTSNSMRHYFSRRLNCSPANKRVGDELPLFTESPREYSSQKPGFWHP